MTNLKRFDTGGLRVARLQTGDDLPAAVAELAVLVEIGIERLADEASVALVHRQLVGKRRGEGALDPVRDALKPEHDAVKLLRQTEHIRGAGEVSGEGAGAANCVAHGPEIARTASQKREARQCAGEVRRPLQLLSERLAQARLAGEIAHGVQTRIDGSGIGQRTAEAAGKLPRARAGHGAVDGCEQAACAGTLIGADKLEISAGRGVDNEQASWRLLVRGTDERGSTDLGDFHIGKQSGEGRELGLGEIAESVERGDAETPLQRPLAAR